MAGIFPSTHVALRATRYVRMRAVLVFILFYDPHSLLPRLTRNSLSFVSYLIRRNDPASFLSLVQFF